MVQAMRAVFSAKGIDVNLASDQALNRPDLDDLDVDPPTIDGPITAEQAQLFSNHDPNTPDQIFVYFVRACSPPQCGCASRRPAPPQFPNARPSVVIASVASLWTLAHECGHILGLSHVVDDKRLMFDTTWDITKPLPDLAADEETKIKASPFTK